MAKVHINRVAQAAENREFQAGTRERMRLLGEYDFSFLVEQLTWKDDLDEKAAHKAVEEYRKFLALAIAAEDQAFGQRHLQGVRRGLGMPSDVVDQVWHRHILFTREYAGFCTSVLGQMLHHSPCTKKNVHLMTGDETQASYRVLFGEMPEMWNQKASFLVDGNGCGGKCGNQCRQGCSRGNSGVFPIADAEGNCSSACSSGCGGGPGGWNQTKPVSVSPINCGGSGCGAKPEEDDEKPISPTETAILAD